MFNVKQLNVAIDHVKILTNISFTLDSNEIICLIGPNGAGKSTLLKTLCGILSFNSGEVSFNKKSFYEWNEKERAREIALVSTLSSALNGFTMNDLLNFSRYPYMGLYRSLNNEEEKLKDELLTSFNLESFLNRDLKSLSAGEMQRVLLACAFFQNPSLLLVDEALSNLDPKYKLNIHKKLKEFILNGNRSVIYITHDINEALQIADKIIVMSAGEILNTGTPSDILNSNVLEDAYQIKFEKFNKDNISFLFPKDEL